MSQKELATTEQLGTALVGFAFAAKEDLREEAGPLGDSLLALPGITADAVKNELFFLRVFAIDYATALTLGETQTTQTILNVFYSHLLAKALGLPSGHEHWSLLATRLEEYGVVVRESDQDSLPLHIGQAFARACGCPMALTLCLLGTLHFAGLLTGVSGFLREFHVVT